MPSPEIDFQGIVRQLTTANIRFVVIGGVAMNLHGADNLTTDMDISFARDRENAVALAKLLSAQNARPRGFPADLPFVIDAQVFRNSTNLTLDTDWGSFDMLAEPDGVDGFEGLWDRAVVMEVDELAVRVASIPDLIAMKRAADRPKDREHIMQLEALQRLQSSAA
ncbi:MAG: hypothetical protein H8F28_20685 [Fibrella sp.]|nr:hypothetical protein [Armatimonadota bacterium]